MTVPQGHVSSIGSGPAPGTGVAPAVTATLATGQESLVRLVDLVPGQRVQGTVVQVLGNGQVMLGLLGGQVLASTNLTFTAGNTYDFTVTAIQPQIVLTAARQLILPTLTGASLAGLLGPAGAELSTQLMDVLARLPAARADAGPGEPGAETHDSTRQLLQRFLGKLADGSLRASDLQQIQQRLGHDQEARVLRLGSNRAKAADQQQQQREIAMLRQTLKAQTLRFLERAQATRTDSAEATAARGLVEGFGRIEVDNAHRAEQGAPQWLPLPVGEGTFLKDARMFVLTETDAEAQQEGTSSAREDFVVVLLLDLTRLGQVRVDVEVRGDAVGVTFRVVDPSTLHLIHAAREELEEQLRGEGLSVRFLRIKPSPGVGESLPVADLLTPPKGGQDDQSVMVDVHA